MLVKDCTFSILIEKNKQKLTIIIISYVSVVSEKITIIILYGLDEMFYFKKYNDHIIMYI